MLDEAIRGWVKSSHEGVHIVSNHTQIGCGIQTMIDLYYRAQNVQRKHYPHNITAYSSMTDQQF